MKVPGLDEAIASHGRLLATGDADAAETACATEAIESHRAATASLAAIRPIVDFQALALARIGSQYISRVRLKSATGTANLHIRWKQSDAGNWVIAEVEDFSGKRSPWSDIPHYTHERGSNGNA